MAVGDVLNVTYKYQVGQRESQNTFWYRVKQQTLPAVESTVWLTQAFEQNIVPLLRDVQGVDVNVDCLITHTNPDAEWAPWQEKNFDAGTGGFRPGQPLPAPNTINVRYQATHSGGDGRNSITRISGVSEDDTNGSFLGAAFQADQVTDLTTGLASDIVSSSATDEIFEPVVQLGTWIEQSGNMSVVLNQNSMVFDNSPSPFWIDDGFLAEAVLWFIPGTRPTSRIAIELDDNLMTVKGVGLPAGPTFLTVRQEIGKEYQPPNNIVASNIIGTKNSRRTRRTQVAF